METALSDPFTLASPRASPSHLPMLSSSPKVDPLPSPNSSPLGGLMPSSTALDSVMPLSSPDFFGLSSTTPSLVSSNKRSRGASFLNDLSMPSPAMTPSGPRRSPRLVSLSTPMLGISSPALPSLLSKNPLDLRRSPRLAATRSNALGEIGSFSPSAFLHSPSITPAIKPASLPGPRPAALSSMKSLSSSGIPDLSSVMKQEADSGFDEPMPGNMSILNKLQQSNKRRRGEWEESSVLKMKSDSEAMLPCTPPEGASSSTPPNIPMPQMQQLPKPLISVMNCPKSTGNGSGSSCHQCKSRRSMNNLIFCCNMFTKRLKDKKKLAKEKRHICRKKYCDQCLLKFYHEKPPSQRQDASSNWPCPSCRGICCCAACRRQKTKSTTGGMDPLTMSPATSLACGLVYFKDMLKFKLGDPAASSAALSAAVAAGAQSAAAAASSSNPTLLSALSHSAPPPPPPPSHPHYSAPPSSASRFMANSRSRPDDSPGGSSSESSSSSGSSGDDDMGGMLNASSFKAPPTALSTMAMARK